MPLQLTTAQKEVLFAFLEWNAQPENCHYLYHYYLDNCSTRVRDAIDRALGGRIAEQFAAAPSDESFRFHTQRLAAPDVFSYLFLMLVWGPTVDRPITQSQQMFVPMRLRDYLRQLTVRDDSGQEVPLIDREEKLPAAQETPIRDRP